MASVGHHNSHLNKQRRYCVTDYWPSVCVRNLGPSVSLSVICTATAAGGLPATSAVVFVVNRRSSVKFCDSNVVLTLKSWHWYLNMSEGIKRLICFVCVEDDVLHFCKHGRIWKRVDKPGGFVSKTGRKAIIHTFKKDQNSPGIPAWAMDDCIGKAYHFVQTNKD